MRRAREEQTEKDREVNETIARIEAPIANITSSLARLISSCQDAVVRHELEDVLRKLVGDLYEPSLDRMQSRLDPVALSLVRSYAASGSSDLDSSSTSRRASLASHDGTTPSEWIELYGLHKWEFNHWDHSEDDLANMTVSMFLYWASDEIPIDAGFFRFFLRFFCDSRVRFQRNCVSLLSVSGWAIERTLTTRFAMPLMCHKLRLCFW